MRGADDQLAGSTRQTIQTSWLLLVGGDNASFKCATSKNEPEVLNVNRPVLRTITCCFDINASILWCLIKISVDGGGAGLN